MQQTLVEYLVNAAWQVPLMAAGAWIVTHVGGMAPRARNLVWLGFLVMAVALPALPVQNPLSENRTVQQVATAAPLVAAEVAALGPAPAEPERPGPWRLLRIGLDCRSATLIKLAFGAASAAAFVRLAAATLAARRLVRDSSEFAMPKPLADALDRFARVHARKVPPVRSSARLTSPVVVGALSPLILVPERFARHTEDEQQAALLHEFAHVLRRDYAVNLACELLAVPLSWHPALYQIKAGVRRSRELACDTIAAAAMASDGAYARCLLSLAKSLGAQPTGGAQNNSAVLVGLFGKSSLEERLMHLLTRKATPAPALGSARMVAAALLATSILVPATLLHVSPALAEDQAPAAAQAQAQADAAPAPAVAATPATPSTPAVPAAPARPAAPAQHARVHVQLREPADPAAPHESVITRRVRTDDGHESVSTYRFTDDGDFHGLSEDQQRRIEESVKRAMERTEAVRKMLDSPEFKQRMADLAARQKEFAAIDQVKIQKQVDAAMATLKDAHVQEAMARAQARMASAAMRESLEEAARIQRDVDKAMRESEPKD